MLTWLASPGSTNGIDEEDGGPPEEARYITEDTHAYRLPAMDLEFLIYGYDAYGRYLTRALDTS